MPPLKHQHYIHIMFSLGMCTQPHLVYCKYIHMHVNMYMYVHVQIHVYMKYSACTHIITTEGLGFNLAMRYVYIHVQHCYFSTYIYILHVHVCAVHVHVHLTCC